MDAKTLGWFTNQLAAFNDAEAHFEAYKQFLENALRYMIKSSMLPEAVIQVRAKGRGSFVGKILRKKEKYKDQDCLKVLTDLCAGRVIVHTKSEVERVCTFLRDHFVIDKPNSLDKAEQLQAAEFGYRSVHLIISLSEAKLATMKGLLSAEIIALAKPQILNLKAEIQVRTIAQHAWADIGHNRVYKSEFEVPYRWKRELAKIAALLEDADDAFTRIIEGLSLYQASYGLYGDPKKMEDELEILGVMLAQDANNANLVCQAARLAMCLGKWGRVSELVNDFPAAKTADILVYQGEALSRLHEDRGQVLTILREAVRIDSTNVKALTALAEKLAPTDEDEVFRLYGKAFATDPTNPRVLGGYLRFKLSRDHERSFIPLIRPTLEAAIAKCRDLAQVGIDRPWAYRHIGEFNLLLARPDERLQEEADDLPKPDERNYESLAAFAKAIQLPETTDVMLDEWLKALELLAKVKPPLEGLEWGRRLLLLGKAVKSRSSKSILSAEKLPSAELPPVEKQVVLVAGSCSPVHDKEMAGYGILLEEAFADFEGTLFSGGTTAGIGGLVGNLADKFKGRISAFGYLPSHLPTDAPRDQRYTNTYKMKKADRFSPLQPLQNWIDLIALGIDPVDVKLLGIKGGPIAAFEYRLALALGAQVGVLLDSGLEVGNLRADPDWRDDDGLVLLSQDGDAVKRFLQRRREIQPLARRIHEEYLLQHKPKEAPQRASLVEWRDLPENFREDNRQAAEAHLAARLPAFGLTAAAIKDREKIVLHEILDKDVEKQARLEHERWMAKKLEEGWKWGEERNDERRTNPKLKAWEELPAKVRDENREMIRQIPRLLKAIGLEVRPIEGKPEQ